MRIARVCMGRATLTEMAQDDVNNKCSFLRLKWAFKVEQRTVIALKATKTTRLIPPLPFLPLSYAGTDLDEHRNPQWSCYSKLSAQVTDTFLQLSACLSISYSRNICLVFSLAHPLSLSVLRHSQSIQNLSTAVAMHFNRCLGNYICVIYHTSKSRV